MGFFLSRRFFRAIEYILADLFSTKPLIQELRLISTVEPNFELKIIRELNAICSNTPAKVTRPKARLLEAFIINIIIADFKPLTLLSYFTGNHDQPHVS